MDVGVDGSMDGYMDGCMDGYMDGGIYCSTGAAFDEAVETAHA